MEKYLTLVFVSEAGKNVSIKIDSPKDDLQAEIVKDAMTRIIGQNVLVSTDDARVAAIVSADVTTKSVVEFAVK